MKEVVQRTGIISHEVRSVGGKGKLTGNLYQDPLYTGREGSGTERAKESKCIAERAIT